jgi:hypothetical protein
MNRFRSRFSACFLAVTFFLPFPPDVSAQSDPEPPVYKPPVRGAPASRVGGGSRGVGTELPRMYVLAPVDIGFTTKGKPDLYWFASEPSKAKVVLSIYTDDPAKPLLEQVLPPVSSPGIQRVRLADFPLELQPRVEYRWRVTMIDEARPARAVASGAIQRINVWPKLQARIQNQGSDILATANVYAEEGLWYDALEAIGQSGETPRAWKSRAALLQQVGLAEVSQHEAGRK